VSKKNTLVRKKGKGQSERSITLPYNILLLCCLFQHIQL
jgi:hypothetical protein